MEEKIGRKRMEKAISFACIHLLLCLEPVIFRQNRRERNLKLLVKSFWDARKESDLRNDIFIELILEQRSSTQIER